MNSTKRSSNNILIFYLNSTFLSIIISLLLVTVISTVFTNKLSSEIIGTWLNKINNTAIFLTALQSQNHYIIGKGVELDKIPVQSMLFQLATNIKPNDVRSLLGNEIPGFYAFDYRIHIAGEGTDYTTLPHESSPPMEVLLKEREIAHEQLEEKEEEISPPPAPEKTIEKELVYIYQSHSWESFLPLLKGAKTPDEATSNNSKVNVIAVGNMLKEKLLSNGIIAKHNTTNVTEKLLSRGWNYYNSYQYSREVVEEVLSSNNELKYLIDIHRDSVRKDKTHINIDGKDFAKLLFIVGEENKNFEDNLEFASKLHYAIEEHFPGLSRGVVIKNKSEGDGIYNQDLSDRSILLEVGGVDNTMKELDNSVEVFAKYFSELIWVDKDVGDF
ncbi:MAG: stage II sporulation protein P [Bacillota bacterium]|nr:stage II sporulation protein P [Bacillota bacterium]